MFTEFQFFSDDIFFPEAPLDCAPVLLHLCPIRVKRRLAAVLIDFAPATAGRRPPGRQNLVNNGYTEVAVNQPAGLTTLTVAPGRRSLRVLKTPSCEPKCEAYSRPLFLFCYGFTYLRRRGNAAGLSSRLVADDHQVSHVGGSFPQEFFAQRSIPFISHRLNLFMATNSGSWMALRAAR